MKGMTAFACISDIDLDLIEESVVLLELGTPYGSITAPRRGRESALSRFFGSGWGVAMICAVVSISVLCAIVWAGWGEWVSPPVVGTEESDTPAESESPTEAETLTPSEKLAFRSNGDGTCILTGIGKCRDERVVVPTHSPDGDRVIAIAEGAFKSCDRLVGMILPEGITEIPDECFYDCGSLALVTIPEGVEVIGEYAFSRCTALTEVKLPSTLRRVEAFAFNSCRAVTALDLPDGLEALGRGAFARCEGLIGLELPAGVTDIGQEAFLECTGLRTVTLPDGVERMEHSTFFGCTALTEINWPAGVTEVPSSAFMNCLSLASVVLPKGVTEIQGAAFEGCTALHSVTLPDSLMEVGSRAFEGCRGLKDIYYGGSQKGWNRVRIDSDGNRALTQAVLHENYGEPIVHPEITEGGLIFISQGDGTCKIKGADRTYAGEILVPEKSPFGDTVTAVAAGAFKGFKSVTAVTLPETVTVIKGSAFQGCSSLKTVTLPQKVTEFGRAMFDMCGELTAVVLPLGVTEIPAMTFQTCVSLQRVEAGDTITAIGACAFNGCRSLGTLTLPKGGLKSVGSQAFLNCCGLHTVYYGGSRQEWDGVEIHPTDNSRFEYVNVVFTGEE